MEKLLNPHDNEYMRVTMLKHEETFRDQVNELHRLYRTQKILAQDLATIQQNGTSYWNDNSRARKFLEPENRAEGYNLTEADENSTVLEAEDDQSDLELTLGPRSYYHWKIKPAREPGIDLSGFSTSSSSGSSSWLKKNKRTSKQNQ